MSADGTSLLILANCGRAMAESASRGGYRVSVLDAFCDHDTMAVADCWPVSQGFSHLDRDMFIDEMASIFPQHPSGVVYGAGLEEASSLLARLSTHYHLFGNDPSVLEILRKPQRFFALLNRLRIPYPQVSFTPPYSAADKSWLIKRSGSCGGQGVAYFDAQHSASDSTSYYQKYTVGRVMSILFIADGQRHRTIGYNRLGMKRSNAPAPFLYTGAVGQVTLSEAGRQEVEQIVDKLVSELALCGVNSLDFIHNDDGIFVIDLNPRPTATLELYEHLTNDGWIKQHVQACLGELPMIPIIGSTVMHGHQIVYSPRTIEIPIEMSWPQWVKDRPLPRARVLLGQPLCSIFTKGSSAGEVESRLAQRQVEVLRLLGIPTLSGLPRRAAL
jgi:predicted ATP-grasp superfamily ATP-dependent carboligase